MSENRTADVIVAMGIGMVVGAVAALLLAPAAGDETRRRIGDAARDATDKARGGADSATQFVQDQKDRLGHAIHEGKRAYQEGPPAA